MKTYQNVNGNTVGIKQIIRIKSYKKKTGVRYKQNLSEDRKDENCFKITQKQLKK